MNVRTSEILRTRMAHNLDTRLGIRHSHLKHRVRPAHVIERRAIHDGKPARLVELHRSNVLLIDIDRERSTQRARDQPVAVPNRVAATRAPGTANRSRRQRGR